MKPVLLGFCGTCNRMGYVISGIKFRIKCLDLCSNKVTNKQKKELHGQSLESALSLMRTVLSFVAHLNTSL